MISSHTELPLTLKRIQFPVGCFAATANKIQRQTLDFVDVYCN